jgi:cytochrome c2
MGFRGRGIYSLFIMWGVLFSLTLAPLAPAVRAQSSAALNEQQAMGKTLFNQNCRLCHEQRPAKAKDPTLEDNVGPNLAGLFGPPRSRAEAAVRVFIQVGVPNKMPGFRYGLKAEEIDAIIAYLKTL